MISTYATSALQPIFYAYAASVVIAAIVWFSVFYALRDMIGGFVLAGIVYYLYTM